MKNKFAERFKILRIKNKLTQKAMSKELGLKQSTISKWEKGTSEPSYNTLIKISKYFEVKIGFLLGLED